MLSTKTRRLLLFLFLFFLAIQFTDLWLTLPKLQGHFNGFVQLIHTLMFGVCLFIRAVDLVKNHPCLHSSKGLQLRLGPCARSYTCQHTLIQQGRWTRAPCRPLLCEHQPILEPLQLEDHYEVKGHSTWELRSWGG